MTDAFEKLKRELRRAAPSPASRTEGVEAAMAAFEEEFAASRVEDEVVSQGKAVEPRLREAKGADTRRPQRRTLMRKSQNRPSDASSRWLSLTRKFALYGGSGLLTAGLAVAIFSGRWEAPMSELTMKDAARDGAASPRRAPEAKKIAPPPARSDLRIADLVSKHDEDEAERGGEGFLDRERKPLPPVGDVLVDEDRVAAARQGSREEAEIALRSDANSVDDVAEAAERPAEIAQAQTRASTTESRPAPSKPPSVTTGRFRDGLVVAELEQDQQRKLLTERSGEAEKTVLRKEELSRDRFEKVEANPVRSVLEAPVSTFSIDVDTSAYSFMRASLNQGRLPHPSAVRIEEMVNYFDYAYPAPASAETPFAVNVAVTPTPWSADTRLLHVGIKGYEPQKSERPRTNLVLLVDVSGSMQAPNKLPLAVNALKLLLGELGADDKVSIVTYAAGVRVALKPTAASEKGEIRRVLEGLTSGGGTAGSEGLRLAYEQAQAGFDKDAVNRVILATDGDFNIGFSSPEEMKRFVEEKRRSGVFLSVLGFGMGNYNSHLMQSLAQNGNGVAAYIDTLAEARKVLADEAGGALIPIAKDVKVQVEFNPSVISEYRLIGYETRALRRQDFKNDKVDAGDIGSGHTVTAIYEITPKGSPAELFEPLRYAGKQAARPVANSEEIALLKLRYKAPDGDVSREIRRPVTETDAFAQMGDAPTETRFAAAVSAFAEILRGDPRMREFGYDGVLALAEASRGADPFGYRAEFLNLVRLARSIDDRSGAATEER